MIQTKKGGRQESRSKIYYVTSNFKTATFCLSGYTVEDAKDHPYNKHNIYISILPSNLITKGSIEIEKDTPLELIDEVIAQKTYEELRVVGDAQLSLSYLYRCENYDGTKLEYDVFSVENQAIIKRFGTAITKFPYLDYIIPNPFLFLALYSAEIIQRDGVHLFIYYRKDDAFLTIFEDGKLVYVKTIGNLSKVYESFNLHSKEGVDYDTFCGVLNGSIVDIKHTTPLKKIEDEMASEIDDSVVYAKKIHSVGVPSRIYIDSDDGFCEGFYEFLYAYLNIKTQKFDFNYGFTPHNEINHMGMLALLNAKEFQKGFEDKHNFNIFFKPKPFQKRDAGHFLIGAVASFMIAFSYPLYNFISQTITNMQNSKLQERVNALNIDFINKKAQVENLTKQKQDKNYRLGIALKETDRYQNMITNIYSDVEIYTPKVELVLGISRDILDSGIQIKRLNIDDENQTGKSSSIILEVVSNEHKKITDFIKTVADKRIYDVSAHDIFEDKNDSKYTSTLSIKLR